MTNATLIDQDLVERVLAAASARGGDFAEIFVEDRHTNSAMLDQRRIEELTSGRERGAGIRVVIGEIGRAHV